MPSPFRNGLHRVTIALHQIPMRVLRALLRGPDREGRSATNRCPLRQLGGSSLHTEKTFQSKLKLVPRSGRVPLRFGSLVFRSVHQPDQRQATPPFPRARAEPSEQSQRDQRSAYLLDFSRGKAGIKKLDGPSGSRLNVTTFATTLATRDSEAGIGLPRVDAEGPLRPDVRTRLGMHAPQDDP